MGGAGASKQGVGGARKGAGVSKQGWVGLELASV